MKTLQQSTALWPFPWKFIILTLIAGRASQYQIANIIGGNIGTSHAIKRERMVDVVDVFFSLLLKLGVTTSSIIALISLCFQLNLNLFRRVGSCNLLLTGSAAMRVGAMDFFPLWTCAIGSFLFLYLWTPIVRSPLFPILWLAQVSFIPSFIPDVTAYPYLWTAFIFLAVSISALTSFRTLSIRLTVSFSAFLVLIIPCFKIFAILRPLSVNPVIRILTIFTYSAQLIFLVLVFTKEFCGNRMPLIVFGTIRTPFQEDVIWGYTVSHSYLTSLIGLCSLGLICASNTVQAVFCYLHCTIHPPVAQVREVYV